LVSDCPLLGVILEKSWKRERERESKGKRGREMGSLMIEEIRLSDGADSRVGSSRCKYSWAKKAISDRMTAFDFFRF
jgi:hypothetical protein